MMTTMMIFSIEMEMDADNARYLVVLLASCEGGSCAVWLWIAGRYAELSRRMGRSTMLLRESDQAGVLVATYLSVQHNYS